MSDPNATEAERNVRAIRITTHPSFCPAFRKLLKEEKC